MVANGADQDVARLGAPEPVHRLIVVANDRHIACRPGEQVHERWLDLHHPDDTLHVQTTWSNAPSTITLNLAILPLESSTDPHDRQMLLSVMAHEMFGAGWVPALLLNDPADAVKDALSGMAALAALISSRL